MKTVHRGTHEYLGSVKRAGLTRFHPAGLGKAGAGAGGAFPSAHSGFTNASVVGVPAAQTAATWIIPLTGLLIGDILTEFGILGQIESGGNAVTVDATLRKLTAVADNITDESLGGITQVSVTADTVFGNVVTGTGLANAMKVLAAEETVGDLEAFYVLVTITTGAATDVQLLGAFTKATEV